MRPSVATRYGHIAASLGRAIAAGQWTPGARLPSEADLCRQHGVSRGTVVKALDQLVAEGLVSRQQGLGSFVAPPALRRRASGLASFSGAVAAQGLRATQRLLVLERVPDAEACAAGHAEPTLRLTRLRLVDGVPWALHVTMLPEAVVASLPEAEARRLRDPAGSDFSLYEAMDAMGRAVESAEDVVSARLARPEEARLLGLARPAALLVVVRHGRDAVGRRVETTEACYEPRHYRFEVELGRGIAARPPPGPAPAATSSTEGLT